MRRANSSKTTGIYEDITDSKQAEEEIRRFRTG